VAEDARPLVRADRRPADVQGIHRGGGVGWRPDRNGGSSGSTGTHAGRSVVVSSGERAQLEHGGILREGIRDRAANTTAMRRILRDRAARRRLVDIFVIFVVAAGLVFGAYTLGRTVTRTSNEGFRSSSLPTQVTTGHAESTSGGRSPRRTAQIVVGLLVLAVIVWIAVLFMIDALRRFRRRRLRRQQQLL
jgi:hypothetical protein